MREGEQSKCMSNVRASAISSCFCLILFHLMSSLPRAISPCAVPSCLVPSHLTSCCFTSCLASCCIALCRFALCLLAMCSLASCCFSRVSPCAISPYVISTRLMPNYLVYLVNSSRAVSCCLMSCRQSHRLARADYFVSCRLN